MSCGCGNKFCEPAEPRCECQQNCWMGPPDEYADCIAACPTDCGFPRSPGLPSKGYRCASHPSADYHTCELGCESDLNDAIDSCIAARDACLGASSAEEDEACLSADCYCEGNALRDAFLCKKECDRSYAFTEALACAAAEVESDADCCNVDLSTCLEPCELAYLTAMAEHEDAWLDCVELRHNTEGIWTPGTAESLGTCTQVSNPDYFYCDAQHDVNASEAVAALRICRATCEAAEMQRHEPEQRKLRECGAQQHICNAECGGDVEEEANLCSLAYFLATADCDADDSSCWQAAGVAYRACMYDVIIVQVGCRKDCCKAQNPNVRNEHLRADYLYDCWKTRLDSEMSCANDRDACMSDCATGDEICAADCDSDYCTCMSDAQDTYHTCSALAPRGDCPNCFDQTIRDYEPPGDDPEGGYSTGTGGLPALPSEDDCA